MIFTVLALAVGAYALLQSLVIPVLPTIMGDLHTSQRTVTWVLTAYLLSASVSTPVVGRIGDAIGKKKMLLVALLALAAGSVLAATTTSISVMIVARAVQGVGGGVLPLAFGIIRDELPEDKVGGAIGVLAALTAVGGGIGLVLAGPIVDALDYHWLFWLPAIMVALGAVATLLVVPESGQRSASRISVLPAVLLSAWLICLLLALSQAPQWGWRSASVIGLLAAAVILAVAWVVVESRSAAPLIDMAMMRLPAVWTTNLVALLVGVGMYSVFAFLPEFVQTPSVAGYGFGASITESGLLILPMSVSMFVMGMASGPLSNRFGSKAVAVAGTGTSVVSFALMTTAHGAVWEICLGAAVTGLGSGLAFAAMSSLVVAAVRPDQTGVASGMNANIRTIGGSIGAALMSTIVTSGAAHNGLPRETGYTHGFAMLTAAAVLSVVAAFMVPATRRAVATSTVPELAPHAELGLVAAGTLAGDLPE